MEAEHFDLSSETRETLHCLSRLGEVTWSQARLYLVLGDVHGHVQRAFALAIRLQCLLDAPFEAVFQVGDFGFWPRGRRPQYAYMFMGITIAFHTGR